MPIEQSELSNFFHYKSTTMEKVSYLLDLLGKDVKDFGFEEITPPNILKQVSSMISTPLITDSYESETTIIQQETESSIKEIYKGIISNRSHCNAHFEVENHVQYIESCLLTPLPGHFCSLDPNHSWMLYWLLNSGKLLNHQFGDDIFTLAKDKLSQLVVDGGKGGMAGGNNQMGHVASTYAGVLALVTIEAFDVLESIRLNLYDWLMSLKQDDGSFIMHVNGEADTRSTYCVVVICSLLNMLTDEITENTLQWIVKSQTFEGGFSGIHDTEAHGGYTFCALASLFLLLGNNCHNKTEFTEKFREVIDLEALIRWLVLRQLSIEGGLNGRSNKLVDSCYSFWIGASLAMVESLLETPIYDKKALKIYIINCAQRETGGFRDKPGKSVDFYHTNYSLSGLSMAEHQFKLSEEKNTSNTPDFFCYEFKATELDEDTNTAVGSPVFGIPIEAAKICKKHFIKTE